jgi:hypothetical protein
MELYWQLEGSMGIGPQPSIIIILAAGAGLRLGSCLPNDHVVPVQFSPVGTCMWLVVMVVIGNEWT